MCVFQSALSLVLSTFIVQFILSILLLFTSGLLVDPVFVWDNLAEILLVFASLAILKLVVLTLSVSCLIIV